MYTGHAACRREARRVTQRDTQRDAMQRRQFTCNVAAVAESETRSVAGHVQFGDDPAAASAMNRNACVVNKK